MTVIDFNVNLENAIMVGDRVLIQPSTPKQTTKSGLFLPPGVQEKEKIITGYILKVGPGYPIPAIADESEPWKDNSEQVKYIPIQPEVGDLAVFLQNSSFEIQINNKKFLIVPNAAILMLFRDNELLK